MNWFKQAVTGSDNRTYEGAYLALAVIIALVGLTIVSMLILAGVEITLCDRKLQKECFNAAGLGGGIAAAIAAVGAFLGGVGAYILMDRKPLPPATTTTTEQSTMVKTVAAVPAAIQTDPTLAVSAVSGAEPLSPAIKPSDVGKNVAIVAPKRRKHAKAKSRR